MFAFCGNDPVNNKDLSGNFFVLAAAAIGGLIGAATSAFSTWVAGGDGIEILTAAIAGMGAGAISVVSPALGALITAYATYEIDIHMQNRLSPNEEANTGLALAKAAASGLISFGTGIILSKFDFIDLSDLQKPVETGFTMATYYFTLVNATVILPVSTIIDRCFSKPDKPKQYSSSSSPNKNNKIPPYAPPRAMYV